MTSAHEELKAIDAALLKVWQRVWHLRWLQPTNLKEERERFLVSDNSEPRFTYPPLDFDPAAELAALDTLNAKLAQLDADAAPSLALVPLFTAKIAKLRSWISLLATRGTTAFTEHAIAYYGAPDKELVADAERLFAAPEASKDLPTIDTAQAAELLQREAERLGIDCAVVVKGGLASRADCVLPERTLYLRKGARFTKRDIKKLAVHELGVHARRAMNGLRQPYKLFFLGTAEYETTEEGLAGLFEERAGVASGMRTKGALTLAVNHALQHSFRSTYRLLSTKFPPERAFHLTVRVKRGLGDTEAPGAFTKDHIYLKGLRMVEQLAEEQLERLFLGRVAVEDLPVLEKLEPHFFKL